MPIKPILQTQTGSICDNNIHDSHFAFTLDNDVKQRQLKLNIFLV